MLWYLTEAFILQKDKGIKDKINSLLDNTEALTLLDVDSLLALDIESHRTKVNMLLKNTSELCALKPLKERIFLQEIKMLTLGD